MCDAGADPEYQREHRFEDGRRAHHRCFHPRTRHLQRYHHRLGGQLQPQRPTGREIGHLLHWLQIDYGGCRRRASPRIGRRHEGDGRGGGDGLLLPEKGRPDRCGGGGEGRRHAQGLGEQPDEGLAGQGSGHEHHGRRFAQRSRHGAHPRCGHAQQQRPALHHRRCADQGGHARAQCQRHREHPGAEGRFFGQHLRFACGQRRHHRDHQERQGRQAPPQLRCQPHRLVVSQTGGDAQRPRVRPGFVAGLHQCRQQSRQQLHRLRLRLGLRCPGQSHLI